MLFNSLQFVLFFLAVLSVYRLLPRSGRCHFLLASSLLFYSLWIPVYTILLGLEIVANYYIIRVWVVKILDFVQVIFEFSIQIFCTCKIPLDCLC